MYCFTLECKLQKKSKKKNYQQYISRYGLKKSIQPLCKKLIREKKAENNMYIIRNRFLTNIFFTSAVSCKESAIRYNISAKIDNGKLYEYGTTLR